MIQNQKNQSLITRPPVVVVLGHIDHGKTTLLDYIRKTKIAEKEAGGITQHIGAYEIEIDNKKITFIDTPGHEAFSAMRARGAKVADIAILIIDATEGVKAQTKEAISQIKKAKIPFIVALNKIDKPNADPPKVKRELVKEGVTVEDLGGNVPAINISAKTGQGVNELLELILLLAEMEELKTDLSQGAQGVIIESYLDHFRGPTATLILNQGILKKGEILATFSTLGKVRILENFQGQPISEAFPSQPVVVVGFEEVPKVGEEFRVFPSLEEAKKFLEKKEEKPERGVLEIEPDQKVLNIILKGDVFGSIEAIEEILKNLSQEKVIVRVLKSEVGAINESDVKLAKSGKAIILGFRVKVNPVAKNLAEREKVKILIFEVIYDLVEGTRKLIERMIEPEIVRVDLAKVKVLVHFWAGKNRQIVGGRVIEGEVKKGAKIEVFRDDELLDQGKMVNLQIEKKDVERAKKGDECGILYEGGNVKIEPGDILVIYQEEKRKPLGF